MPKHPLQLRHEVRESVRRCTACSLSTHARSPIPFSGPSPATIAVITEAPEERDDQRATPFLGPAGELIRQLLTRSSCDPSQVAFLYAVSCWPQSPPHKSHRIACRPNLLNQLRIIEPTFCLVLGNAALSSTHLSPPTISKARGCWYRLGGTGGHAWCLPTLHPSAYSRGDHGARDLLVEDIQYFCAIATGLGEPSLGQFCCECNFPAQNWDSDFPYCLKHKPKIKAVEKMPLPFEGTIHIG